MEHKNNKIDVEQKLITLFITSFKVTKNYILIFL